MDGTGKQNVLETLELLLLNFAQLDGVTQLQYLEDCEHGKANVVEGGDSVVGSLPLFKTDRNIEVAGVRTFTMCD